MDFYSNKVELVLSAFVPLVASLLYHPLPVSLSIITIVLGMIAFLYGDVFFKSFSETSNSTGYFQRILGTILYLLILGSLIFSFSNFATVDDTVVNMQSVLVSTALSALTGLFYARGKYKNTKETKTGTAFYR